MEHVLHRVHKDVVLLVLLIVEVHVSICQTNYHLSKYFYMKNLQTRREFFKQGIGKALPLLALTVLGVIAPQKIFGSNGCNGMCRSTCRNYCGDYCTGSCANTCYITCRMSCADACAATCLGSCAGSSYVKNDSINTQIVDSI